MPAGRSENLQSIEIPEGVTSIGSCAFYNCISLKKVEILSDQSIVLAAGTLYGALDNLKKSKLIEQMSTEDNSRRKVYCLTKDGKEVLKNDYMRIKKLCFVAKNILEKEDN